MAAVYKSLTKQKSAPKSGGDETEHNAARKHRQRVMILSSRGITYRHRHFMNDLADMMPHARKEAKFDSKRNLQGLCELAEMFNCNNVVYLMARKGETMKRDALMGELKLTVFQGKDLYIYFSRVPNGVTIKMLVENIHTTDDLNMPGNCLKGSRPILSFDSVFEKEPHLKLIKECLSQTFGVPPGARRSKPFVDRVMGFSMLDGKIWVRNYEIREVEPSRTSEQGESKEGSRPKAGGRDTDVSLVDIGPRFILTPILIQESAFGGPIIYENKRFVSPNQVRSEVRKSKAGRHNLRVEQHMERLTRKTKLGFREDGGKKEKRDDLDSRTLFT